MNNLNSFKGNKKFENLYGNNKKLILKLDNCLEEEGYIFNGNWRDDISPGGCNSSFELIEKTGGRKNLVTIRPMKSYLKVEVYWGYSGSIPVEKEPKQYYQICLDQEIPKELIFEIREFYNYLKSKD